VPLAMGRAWINIQCSSNETKQSKQSHAIDNFLNAGILQQHCIA
jgi:hypothetical protein